jgi:hypothetical protein
MAEPPDQAHRQGRLPLRGPASERLVRGFIHGAKNGTMAEEWVCLNVQRKASPLGAEYSQSLGKTGGPENRNPAQNATHIRY